MTLLFAESFDALGDGAAASQAMLTQRGWVQNGGSILSTGRNGRGWNSTQVTTTGIAYYNAAHSADTWIVGFATNMWLTTSWSTFFTVGEGSVGTSIQANTDGSVRAVVGNSGSVHGTSSAGAMPGMSDTSGGTWKYVEVKVKVHASAGTVDVQVNGASVLSLSGLDTDNGGSKVECEFFRLLQLSGGGYDDVYLCDTAGSIRNDFLGDIVVEAQR